MHVGLDGDYRHGSLGYEADLAHLGSIPFGLRGSTASSAPARHSMQPKDGGLLGHELARVWPRYFGLKISWSYFRQLRRIPERAGADMVASGWHSLG